MFNIYTRMASFVPRWSVAPIAKPQNIAEHSYFVALYTMELLPFTDLDERQQMAALRWALIHDLPEVRTGDFPGPVKRRVVDPENLAHYEVNIYKHLGFESILNLTYETLVLQLVKVADMIDEVMFIAYQVGMGNSLLFRQMNMSLERFFEKVRECYCLTDPELIIRTVKDRAQKISGGEFILPHADGDPFHPPAPPPSSINDDDEIPF